MEKRGSYTCRMILRQNAFASSLSLRGRKAGMLRQRRRPEQATSYLESSARSLCVACPNSAAFESFSKLWYPFAQLRQLFQKPLQPAAEQSQKKNGASPLMMHRSGCVYKTRLLGGGYSRRRSDVRRRRRFAFSHQRFVDHLEQELQRNRAVDLVAIDEQRRGGVHAKAGCDLL